MFHSKQDVDRHVNEVFRNIKSEHQRNLKCYQIAKLYFKFKDYKSAIKYINRYILTTTNSAAAHRLLGECYLGLNLKVKALNAFKTSLEFNGIQHDLVLKICSLLMDPEVFSLTPRASYWLDRAESLCPSNPVVFQLREHILKSNSEGKQDSGQLENLILSEIKARPTDVTVRIRLLNFFLETKRYKIAYQHALEIEERNTFSNDHRWYDCLCNIVLAYEKGTNDLGFSFHMKKLYFLERRADLFLQEFGDEVKTLSECSQALFVLDQSLHTASNLNVSIEDSRFLKEVLKHLNGQLAFHLATLALKRAKKEYGIWPRAVRTASPLLLLASQTSMDLEDEWYSSWVGKNKMELEVQKWSKCAMLRVSQAGHILLAWSENKGSKFLEKVSQFCGGKWQNQAYQELFYSKEHLQATGTSQFINDSFFSFIPMRLLTETDLKQYDDAAQSTYPDSLHHLVWLGLANCDANGQLNHDFRCTTVADLQFTVENLSQTGPETLNQLDVDAFLYASVMCAKSTTTHTVNSDRPNRIPVSISEELCTPAQAEWWVAVYKTYKNQANDIAEMRLKIRRGIETIRVSGQHGLDIQIIVMLAKLFQERAAGCTIPVKAKGLEERAYLYWSTAIPLLERVEKNQKLRAIPNALFSYRGSDLTPNKIKGYLEEGKLFIACRLMKLGHHEEAIEALQALRSPYATFYQGLIYEKLASEEVNHKPESITSENRSQHIILLTRARDAFYLTSDRLRCPSVESNHPLNSQLQDHLEQIEKQLAMIDPDNSVNRNGDSESDGTDTVPHPLSPDIDDNVGSSLNIFNTSNFLNVKNHGTPRNLRQNMSDKRALRFEARPSPERLDAQLRHLVQANNNGLQAILEHLKDLKSIFQIELKDLGCVTRDLLAEMRKWNEKADFREKRDMDSLKPEELFGLGEDDYEDLNQISQPYIHSAPYQNYLMNRPIPGIPSTSAMTYGTPSPVSSVIPPVENPMLPPSFYPTHQIDPALLYQGLGYYQNFPFNDNQNMTDYRGPGVQKDLRKKKGGIIAGKGAYRSPEMVPTGSTTVGGSISAPGVFVTKPEPPNVVITSSDILPAFTSAGTPTLSVTIPPQHIRGFTPSTVPQKVHNNATHPFQIHMPPQAQLVKESPTGKLNSLIPTTTVSTSPLQNLNLSVEKIAITPQAGVSIGEANLPNLTPEINKKTSTQTPIISEPKITFKSSEKKLFESDGQISVLEGEEWKEHGLATIKIVHNEEQKKLKVITLRDPTKLTSVYVVTPYTVVEPLKNNDFGWMMSVTNFKNDVAKANISALEKEIWPKFCLKFSKPEDAQNFETALSGGLRLVNMKVDNIIQKNTVQNASTKQSEDVKKLGEASDKNSVSNQKNQPGEKLNLGGFTFVSSPVVQPPLAQKSQEVKEKQKEAPKPSPFAAFSFSSPATSTTPPSATKTAGPFSGVAAPASTGASDSPRQLFNANNIGTSDFNLFASVKADPNSFKKDANFKGFKGKDSLLFGHMMTQKTSPAAKSSGESPTNTNKEDDEAEEFVPTAEFTPVIDLPDLVDVKTGEENDDVLFNERAKLLRFDTNTKEWKERGVGNMKLLLNNESGRVRLIMRREIIFKVCCNHYLDESMEFTPLKKSDKALSWYAQDYSEGEFKGEMFALKFKTQDLMMKFLNTVQDTQGKMKDGHIGDKEKNSAQSEKPAELKPLSEMFKPKAGSWECSGCFTRNDENKLKCVCCESPKPGTQPEPVKESGPPKLSAKGIVFPPSTTTFTFGIPQQPSSTLFSKSSTVATTTTATTNTITVTKATTTVVSTGFTFGIPKMSTTAPTSTTQQTQFTFGMPQKNVSTELPSAPHFSVSTTTAAPTSSVSSSFSFGSSATSSSAPLFQTSVKTNFFTPENIAAATKNMNSIFGNSPLSTSNEKQPSSTSSSTTPFTFGSTKSDQASPFSFGSLKLQEKGKFEFSLSNLKASSQPQPEKTPSPKGKVTGGGTSEGSDEEPEEDNGDHIIFNPIVPLPDKVVPHTGEEDENLKYEQRAKLFRFCNKEWKERGIGDVKILKHKVNDKIRLLMRRETVLKVCLNQYVTSDLVFHRKNEKTWEWAAPDFSEGEVKYETFAIRFKTPELAEGFMTALENVKNNVEPDEKRTPEAKESSQAKKNIFGTPASEEDISIIYENKVTPEEREKAVALGLPPNFYSYTQAPDCPGCPGCDKDDGPSSSVQQEVTSSSSVGACKSQPIFGTSSPSGFTFGFGKDSPFTSGQKGISLGKPLFPFSGNQGPTSKNFNTFSFTKTLEEQNKAKQKEDENDDDDHNEDGVEDEEYDEEGEEDEDGYEYDEGEEEEDEEDCGDGECDKEEEEEEEDAYDDEDDD